MSNGIALNSERAPRAVGVYPHSRKIGNILYLSGVGPRMKGETLVPGNVHDENGTLIGYDIEKQCHSVFANVKMILEDCGSHWENIFDVTVYLTNMLEDFDTYNRVYAEYFSNNQPCRTTVEINALPTPIAIELKVLAITN